MGFEPISLAYIRKIVTSASKMEFILIREDDLTSSSYQIFTFYVQINNIFRDVSHPDLYLGKEVVQIDYSVLNLYLR